MPIMLYIIRYYSYFMQLGATIASRYFEPTHNYETGLLAGRFNPPGNHHINLPEYVANQYDLEKISIVIEESTQSARNPLKSNEIEEILETSLKDKETDYEIFTHEIKDFESFMWNDLEPLNENTLYYTGDVEQAIFGKIKQKYTGKNFGIAYEPREKQDLGDEAVTATSGTQIKQAINQGEHWQKYVPPATLKILEENSEALRTIQEANPSSRGKHLDLLKK